MVRGRTEVWANKELQKGLENNQVSENLVRNDLGKKENFPNLKKYDPNKDLNFNFVNLLENVSYLKSISEFNREKVEVSGFILKRISFSKTDYSKIKSFIDKVNVFSLESEKIIVNLVNRFESEFKQAGFNDDFLNNFPKNFTDLKVKSSDSLRVIKDFINFKYNSLANPNLKLSNIEKDFTKVYFDLCDSLDLLIEIYNELKVVRDKLKN